VRSIIEGLRAAHRGRSATEIIRLFGYPKTVYVVVAKYTALEQSKVPVCQRGRVIRKNASRELPQSLKRLKRWFWMTQDNRCAFCDVVKPWMESSVPPKGYLFFSRTVHWLMNHLIHNWLSDNVDMFWSKEFWFSPDLNPLDYVWSWKDHKFWHSNVTSLRIAIEAAFVGMDSATLQCANASDQE